MSEVLEAIGSVWNARIDPVGGAGLAVALAVGLALVLPRQLWRWSRWWLTTLHEAGHAVVGRLTGKRIHSIHLHAGSGGTTTTVGRGGWRSVPGTVAGYPFPAWVGAALLATALTGWIGPLLVVAAAVATLLLLRARNLRAVLAYGAVTAGAATLVWWAAGNALPESAGVAIAALGTLSVLGALRALLEERHARRRRGQRTDPSILAQSTGLPASAWWSIMLLVTLAAALPVLAVAPPSAVGGLLAELPAVGGAG